jgi:hypothetical protein
MKIYNNINFNNNVVINDSSLRIGNIDIIGNKWTLTTLVGTTIASEWDSVERILSRTHTGSVNGSTQTTSFYTSFNIPNDFHSFPTSAFVIRTRRDGPVSATSNLTVNIYINGVIVTNFNIYPTNSGVYQIFEQNMGSGYSGGNNILIEVVSNVFRQNNSNIGVNKIGTLVIKYNKMV